MAVVNFTCPCCAGVFQVPDSLAGQLVTCPHCRSRVALPAAAPVARPLPLAPRPASAPPAGAPTAGAGAVAVHTVRPGAKERRRLVRNLVLWGLGLLIIGLVVAILSILGPIGRKSAVRRRVEL